MENIENKNETKNKQIKVSVIIPVYNSAKYIKRCLDSIYNQTLKELEIIIVNDGSNDDTDNLIQPYLKDDRTVYLKQKNMGISAARNKGLALAKAKYIGFVDADDYIDLNFFEKLYECTTKTNADIACASIVRKHPTFEKWRILYENEAIYTDKKEQLTAVNFPEQCYVWNKLYRKSFFVDLNFQFENGVFYEDIKATAAFILNCEKLAVVPDTNYYYMVNDGQSVVKGPKTEKKETDRYKNQKEAIGWFISAGIELPKSAYVIKKREITFFSIPILKIKENLKTHKLIFFLFNILPIWREEL